MKTKKKRATTTMKTSRVIMKMMVTTTKKRVTAMGKSKRTMTTMMIVVTRNSTSPELKRTMFMTMTAATIGKRKRAIMALRLELIMKATQQTNTRNCRTAEIGMPRI
jgi:hypothetical protein